MLRVSRSIIKLKLEWDDAKAKSNFNAHGVSFELAKTVFEDAFAIDRLDDRENYGEERFVIIGMAEGPDLVVCSLHRARGANPNYFGAEGDAT